MTHEHVLLILFGVVILVLGLAWSRSQRELARVRDDRDYVESQRDRAWADRRQAHQDLALVQSQLENAIGALGGLRNAAQDLRGASIDAVRERDMLLQQRREILRQHLLPDEKSEEAPKASVPRTSVWDLL